MIQFASQSESVTSYQNYQKELYTMHTFLQFQIDFFLFLNDSVILLRNVFLLETRHFCFVVQT